jgi:O-antigen ligase/polysaccharide polymerase Wzy-like membrane protein
MPTRAGSRALPLAGSERTVRSLPFFALVGAGFVFVQDSLHTFGLQAVVTLGLAAMAALMLMMRGSPATAARAKLPAAAVLFVAWACVLLAMTPSKQGVQNLAIWFLFPASIVLVARATNEHTPEIVYRWWSRAAIAAALIYAVLVLQHGPGYTGFLYSERGMGWALLIALALIVPWQRYRPTKLYWIVWLLILVIGLSLTRTAGALALLTAVSLVVVTRTGRLAPGRVLAAFAALGFVGYYAATHIPAIRDRFTQGDQEFHYGGAALNTSGRAELWKATWQGVHEHPWTGHGPGQAQYYIQSIFITVDHPHNEYLRLLYDTGWIGLVLWFTGLVLLARGCWRRMRRATEAKHRAVHLAGFMAMVDFILGSVTDNLTVSLALVIGMGTLVGMSMGLPTPETPDDPESADSAGAYPTGAYPTGYRRPATSS